MKCFKTGFIAVFIFLLFASIRYYPNPNNTTKHTYIAIIYHNNPVYTHANLDSMLLHIGKVPYAELPMEYRKYTGQEAVRSALDTKEYFVLRDSIFSNFIVGHFRIQDFIPKDTFFYLHLHTLPKGISQYWLMDTTLLHKFLDLILALRTKGFNDSALTINNGYRYPKYNAKVEGVKGSQHIYGKALDLKIGDINRDGKTDTSDLEIIRLLLENSIIGNAGGIGVYPASNIIHLDSRGYRARW